MTIRRTVWLAMALLVAAAGCKKSGDFEKKVTTKSTDDATEAVVDEDYRFRIDWPGSGWKLMREKDIQKMSPDAVAGAMYGNDIFGAVIVESAPGAELEPFAQMILDNMPLEDKVTESFEKTRFAGKDAVKFVVRGSTRGTPFVFANNVFFHQDHAYQVIAWGMAGGTRAKSFDPFFGAFSITEGKVTGRQRVKEQKDTRGVGWRYEKGVFESAVTGIRVTAKAPWQVSLGSELAQMNPDAEVGLVHAAPEIYVVFIAEKEPGKDRDGFVKKIRSDMEMNLGSRFTDEGFKTRLGGEELAFSTLRSQAQPPLEFLHAVHFQDGQLIQIIAWYMQAHKDKAREALPEGLASVEFLSEAEKKKLTGELLAAPDPENSAGPGWSLRAGTYRNFTRGVTWQKPRGFWRVMAGEEARAVNPDATLYMVEPQKGLYGLVIVEDAFGVGGEQYHTTVTEGLLGNVKATSKTVGGTPALVSEGETDMAGVNLRYRVQTMVGGGKAAQFLVWGQPADMQREKAEIEKVLDGLRFASIRAEEEAGSTYKNHHMGYAISTPGMGWRRSNQTPPGLDGVGNFVMWEKGGSVVGVLSLCVMDSGQDEEWFLDFLQNLAAEQFASAGATPEEHEATLGGKKARRLTWSGLGEQLDAYLLVRDRTIYAVLLAGARSQSSTFDKVKQSFALLD